MTFPKVAFTIAILSSGALGLSSACSSSSGGNSGSGSSSGGEADATGSSSGSGSSSGAGSSSGTGSSSGAGSSSGTGSSSGSSSGSNLPYTGSFVASTTTVAAATTYSVSAVFTATPEGGAAGGCAGTMSGSCCYVPPGDGGTSAGTATPVGAGTITVKDASNTISTMMPGSSGLYSDSSSTNTMLKWSSGDTLDVSAAGDVVHMFSGSVKAVDAVAGVNPPLSLTTPTTVSTSADFTVNWTTGAVSGATMTLVASAVKLATSAGSITCSGKDSDGKITVPKALLGNFSAGDTGTIVLTREAMATASADNAKVTLSTSTGIDGTATFTQ